MVTSPPPVAPFGSSFLRYPDLFPARASGEAWGEAEIVLSAPGGPYRMLGLAASQAAAVAERFAPLLLTAGTRGAVTLRLFRVSPEDFLAFELRGWQTRFDLAPSPALVCVAGRGFMARVDADGGGAALWTCFEEPGEFLGVFENFLRIVFAYRLLAEDGVLLHSAGVAAAGRAYLFFGRSGAGKSTLAGLSEAAGHDVLSDELNLVSWQDERPTVEALPFAGDFNQRCRPRQAFELGGLFLLAKSPREERRPLSPARALAELAACAPFVNADPDRGETLLANLERLVWRAAPEVLAFDREGKPWDIILRP